MSLISKILLFTVFVTSYSLADAQKTVTQKREISGFSQIVINENFDVELRKGLKQEVIIECAESIIDKIDAFVTGDVLKIQSPADVRLERAKIIITCVSINKITVNGSFIFSKEKLAFNDLNLIFNNQSKSDLKLEIATNLTCRIDKSEVHISGNSGIFN